MYLGRGQRTGSSQQAFEGNVEFAESPSLIQRITAETTGGAITTPMHRAVISQTTQRLRRHRSFHGLKRRTRDSDGTVGVRIGQGNVFWIAQVPRQTVEVAKHVTASARRFTVARCMKGVIEKTAAVHDIKRLRVVQSIASYFASGAGIDDRNRIRETGQHIKPATRFIEYQSTRAATADSDVIRGVRHKSIVFELRGIEDANLARTESS